jgi:hypothetical protein
MSTETTDTSGTSQETGDRIVLTLPGSARLRGVASLVLGGIGSRLDLPYEQVDDLQLAMLSVLAASDLETVTIDVELADHLLFVSIGPLPEDISSDRGLQRVLGRLVDSVEPLPHGRRGATVGEDARGGWIRLGLARSRPGSYDE